MTKMIQCISPVDGRVYAERPALSPEAAAAAVARAKAAQPAWAALPLEERIARVTAGIAALGDEKAAIVEELAWQMGRPTRFGGEFGGVNERTAYMAVDRRRRAGADDRRKLATASTAGSSASRRASSSSSRRGTTPTSPRSTPSSRR